MIVNLLFIIACAPVYLARLTGKGKMDSGIVRFGSWLFGWTFIGWIYALWWAIKK